MVNETIIPMLEPISNILGTVMNTLKFLVGGVFGLYFIFVLYKLYDMRQQKKIIKEIRNDMAWIKRKLMANNIVLKADRNEDKHKKIAKKAKS